MSDQGEKIVHLAYELLGTSPAIPDAPPRHAISFKMLCLATTLTALGSSAATELTHEHFRPVNRYEKTELNALVFYTARLKGVDESQLRATIERQFRVSKFDDLTQGEFLVARQYLQEKAQ